MSTFGQRLENEESSMSLLSTRGSDFGNRYIQADDSGLYLSSLAVTILVSSAATIAILLLTLIVTLSLMLGACQVEPELNLPTYRVHPPNFCASFTRNVEVNNLNGWSLPKDCESFVSEYINGGQYYSDIEKTVKVVTDYLTSVVLEANTLDALVLDVDETALSNVPYYAAHGYRNIETSGDEWQLWVGKAKAPPLVSTLALYRELKSANWSVIFISNRLESQKTATIQNLKFAGYESWTKLIFRSLDEKALSASTYKSKRREDLESEGYHIWSILGDQWTDLSGPAAGSRTFKLPNPIYFVN
ncbi:hypothetical protein O6H91_01G114500 [Diphasiastrum complanatum]|uniref:Uncharacterized protein n=1 Tax=Diphasiastrum complanatum TaxID=34168 RepID=A0ACC2EUZ2_DIPCM|nr:hypothetical protein O6H91_01G114500 [Diphasiastrum complanatum]